MKPIYLETRDQFCVSHWETDYKLYFDLFDAAQLKTF